MLKITRIETTLVRIPLPRNFGGSVYNVLDKNAIITRIHTDHGPIGECINGEGGADIHRLIAQTIQNELAPMLVGKDPTRIEELWTLMWGITHFMGRDRRASVRAIACVDSALWDLLGKRAGLPLYQLWGGARDAVPIVAIGGQYRDNFRPVDYGKEMESYIELGLAGCKFKVGGRSVEEDAARFSAARAAGGESFLLCADANRGWSYNEAFAFAREVRNLGMRWFEEPCHWSNERRDLVRLRQATGVPIAAGQSEITAEGCRDLMVDDAIDVCNLDASWGGGPTVWLRVAKMAACFGVQMAHHGEPLLGAHLVAALEHGTFIETHHPDRDPVFHRMALNRGKIVNGRYQLTKAPGWGITLDTDFVRRYQVSY